MKIRISKLRIISLIIVTPFILAYVYHVIFLEEKTQSIEQQMYEDLMKIETPNNSELYNTYKAHKSDNALVYAEYSTSLTGDTLVGHFMNVLPANGWRYCCNDNDQEYLEYLFKKDEFYAHLFIKTIRDKNKQKYRLSITWGLSGCKNCAEN